MCEISIFKSPQTKSLMLEANNWASESLKASIKLAQLLEGCLYIDPTKY